MMSLTKNPKPKIFFSLQTRRLAESFQGLNQLSSVIISGDIPVQKRMQTVGFQP